MDDFMKFMLISGNLQRMQEELENEPADSLLSKKNDFDDEDEKYIDFDIDALNDESPYDDYFENNFDDEF